jgi:hypothetical protein
METTERIVEAYVRYVKGWATIPNLRCDGQKEIDLFAIDPVTDERWHIETSVSISSGFSALTNEPFEAGEHKERVKAATARRKLGFFLHEKFLPTAVEQRLALFGCSPGKLKRAIVTWDWKPGVQGAAKEFKIELWSLPTMMHEIADRARAGRAYLADDILRTIDLFARASAVWAKRNSSVSPNAVSLTEANGMDEANMSGNTGGNYVYENWTNKRARLHRGTCSYCNAGRGTQGMTGDKNGRWHGPIESLEKARARLSALPYSNGTECGSCMK